MSHEETNDSVSLIAAYFYKEVIDYISRKGLLIPTDINFTDNPLYSTNAGDVLQMKENLTCYDKVLDSLDYIVNETDIIDGGVTLIGNALDVGDPDWMEEYYYTSAFLYDGVPFILIKNSHPWVYPDMAMIYGPQYQMNVSAGDEKISVSPTCADVRDRFLLPTESERTEAVIDYLKHSDRPSFLSW